MKSITLLIFSIFSLCLYSQELNCNVSVNTSRVPGTNKQIFSTMRDAVNDFLNNTSWTNHVYEAHERIECNILIDILENPSANEFKAKIQVQARRPVYGSSYSTVLFNYVDDDFDFTYQEFDPIDYSENTYVSNLSSVLSYYAFIIIGLDYDSYSLKGGDPFFRRAEKIVNNAQSSGNSGWNSADSRERRNRYWLVENLLDSEYQILREFNYKYHRHGLDVMEKSVTQGRSQISETLLLVKRFHENKPDPFMGLLRVVLDSKGEEIVNVFSEADMSEKQRIQKLMVSIDPAGTRKYDRLIK